MNHKIVKPIIIIPTLLVILFILVFVGLMIRYSKHAFQQSELNPTFINTSDYIYYEHKEGIFRVSVNGGEVSTVFDFSSNSYDITSTSNLVVYHDNIYFSSYSYRKSDGYDFGLFYINDNGDAVLVEEYEDSLQSLYAVDGVLYAEFLIWENSEIGHDAYQIQNDGSIGAKLSLSETLYSKIPSDLMEVDPLWSDTGTVSLPYLKGILGNRVILKGQDNFTYFWYDIETGKREQITELNDALCSSIIGDCLVMHVGDVETDSERYFIYSLHDNQCHEINTKLEDCNIAEALDNHAIKSCDQNGLYYTRYINIEEQTEESYIGMNDADDYLYEYRYVTWNQLSRGEIGELLLTSTWEPGCSMSAYNIFNFSVLKDNIYFYRFENGKAQAYQMDKTTHTETAFGDPFCLSPLYEIGKYEFIHKKFHQENEVETLCNIYIEKISLDEKDEAAKQMNQAFNQWADEAYQIGLDNYESVKEDLKEADEDTIVAHSYYAYEEIVYKNESIISVAFSDYQYSYGAAHGSDSIEYHVFDTKTGKQLKLSDVTKNTEDELREKVYEEVIKIDDGYSDPIDIRKVVDQTINYNSSFYIVEQGIVICWDRYDDLFNISGTDSVMLKTEDFKK